MENTTSPKSKKRQFRRGQLATQKRFIPDVPVVNHLGQEMSFYEDLIRNKIVLLHLMSIHHDSKYPIARNLMKVQDQFARLRHSNRFGKDIFIHSITVEPQADSVERLRMFARRHRARNGWQFLTGNPLSIQAIRSALFAHDGIPMSTEPLNEHGEELRDCSLGLLRYGNDAMGLWGSVPGKTNPEMIAERVSWLLPRSPQRKSTTGQVIRRGPFPNQQFRTGNRSTDTSAHRKS